MSKYEKKPQRRNRTKETVGKLTFVDVVYMERGLADNKATLRAVCTCDEWRSSDGALTIKAIAEEAKIHVLNTGHQFRKH